MSSDQRAFRQADDTSGSSGRARDVACAIAYLCSDEASYTTGTELLVAGGWLL